MDQSGRVGPGGLGGALNIQPHPPLKLLYKASYAHMNTKCLPLISRRKKNKEDFQISQPNFKFCP